MQIQRGTAFNWIRVVMILTTMIIGTHSFANPYSTGDGLSLTFDGSGRATNLTVESYTVTFSSGETGGFYIRDNTIDPYTGLPQGVTLLDNLLQCPGFQDAGVECLTTYWTETVPSESSDFSEYEPNLGSGEFVAQAVIDELPDDEEPSWAILSQVVNLGSTTTNDLYYLMFDVTTESGWRPYNHPDGHDPNIHGKHKIFARVEWFDSSPAPLPVPQPEPAAVALAVSTIDAYETSVFDPGDGEEVGMTRFCLRTHRPLMPAEATRARISLVVQGFLPNDGTLSNDNFVQFDNVNFFKAPDMVQVTGYGSAGNFQPLSGLNALSMWVEITDVSAPGEPHYIRFDGAVQNMDTDPTHNPRAIDLGFALPILDDDDVQHVTWWDDGRNSTEISASGPTSWVPYRLTGPVDQRAATNLWMRAESGGDMVTFNTRTENNQISAYPFSAIDIENGNDGPYGVSFGEHLGDTQVPADPRVAHFGYRIEKPTSPIIGRYYMEFNLGLLKPSVGNAEAPFSFILFRSDNPSSVEPSSFKDGTAKYQTTFFPFAFTRPDHLPLDDEWLFGGGVFAPQWRDARGDWWGKGFTKDPNDFGLRYTRNADMSILEQYLTYGDERNVRVLIYDRPWTADFIHNQTLEDYANTYTTLQGEAHAHMGGEIYRAKEERQLKQLNVNGGISDLFSRGFINNSDSPDKYTFPALLADLDNTSEYSIIEEETDWYTNVYTQLSVPTPNPDGLAGLMYDNVFSDMSDANHLDQAEARLIEYCNLGGAPTYSFNNFMPAIPQLITNARFLDIADTLLAEIDDGEIDPDCNYGEGSGVGSNTTEELLSGNIAQADFGGTKYGLMKFGVAGFESNAAMDFNRSEESLAFMRTMARDKSMTRKLLEFPCDDFLDGFEDLGLEDVFVDVDQLRLQLVNEVTWMTLAWGFHPGITWYLPSWPTQSKYYNFVEDYLRTPFNFWMPNNPRRGYTHIFDELHLAGWDPVTNVEIDLENSNQDISELFWERFGGYGGDPGLSNLTYVTVLNNKGLQFTLLELFENKSGDLPKLKDIKDEQQLEDLNLCECLFTTGNGAVSCGDIDFRERDKNIWLKIFDPINMGLWAYNIHAVQLVGYTPGVLNLCNAPFIEAAYIEEGPTSNTYSIARFPVSPDGPVVRIGGQWQFGIEGQQSVMIPDKALMVFKLWSTDIAGNGRSGGGDGDTSRGQEAEDQLISAYYERYGQGWTRSETLDGHEGNTDAVRADSPGACAYFKIHAGLSGHYQVRVHFPPNAQATGAARYEVFLTDYLLDPAGSVDLGEPIFSAQVDQSDAEGYDSARQDDGFVPIGDLDIAIDEGYEVATVVVKLSCPDGASESISGSPTLLLADAVRLARIE